ncbi:MAG: thioredoxin family protein [Proteobacteria bacterium]|nr:thioredoxin family protein [Pseudomonadota bacterium]
MAFSKTFEAAEPARAEVDLFAGPTVLEFGTPWCAYCIGAQAVLESAFRAYPNVRHLKIEDGSGRPLGRSFRVKLWPTLIFLRDGKEVARLVRPGTAQEVEQALQQIDGSA